MCWGIEAYHQQNDATYLVENSRLQRDETRARFPAVFFRSCALAEHWTDVQEGALSDRGTGRK